MGSGEWGNSCFLKAAHRRLTPPVTHYRNTNSPTPHSRLPTPRVSSDRVDPRFVIKY
ncbi:MAG: hypothetical protein DSM106950_14285 [Stigonema ocellatum SAG 48.90 = DSM 106950]|nr:hypothetical protein [Stigonema ocellatum SAG 48.90 = DSM 106950]